MDGNENLTLITFEVCWYCMDVWISRYSKDARCIFVHLWI